MIFCDELLLPSRVEAGYFTPNSSMEIFMFGAQQFGNLWSIEVLCLLLEAPMHPYQMQRLIRQRHKDHFLDLKRGSLYHSIERLKKQALIEEESTSRDGGRPERTVYRITPAGEQELIDSLRRLLSKPGREQASFIAGLSSAAILPPDDVLAQLEFRSREIQFGIVASEAVIQKVMPQIGRLFLIEAEYAIAMARAELDWVQKLIDDLRSGRLTWDPEQLLANARAGGSPCGMESSGSL
jgi:DNA-binding PadR family transcriptional regulator